MSYALTYESEDIVASLLGLTVLSRVVPDSGFKRYAWLAAHAPRLATVQRRRSRGLVLAVGQSPQALVDQLPELPRVDAATPRIAIVEELWRDQLPLRVHVMRFLSRFDHVFLGSAGSCKPLQELIDRPVSYLPHAVDAQRFLHAGDPPRRIDVYSMGRRNAAHHEVLCELARSEGLLYLYDTFTRNPPIRSTNEHRENLAGLIRRSRVFMVNEAKVGERRREAQSEVGYRYFEGAMGGAVMVGQRPNTPDFSRLFPWTDVVFQAVPDGSDLKGILTALRDDPTRLAGISLRNTAGSLRRHDVAHRVRLMLSAIGLPEPDSVSDRIEHLAAEADRLESSAA